MDLNPRSTRINYRLVVWIAIVTFILCLMCILLRVKLDTLMDAYAMRQLSRQASLMAELVNEKVRVRLDALSVMAKHIEDDFEHMDYVVRNSQNDEEDVRYGIMSLEGELFVENPEDQILVSDFRCVVESFHGKPSVCFRHGKGLLLSVPVYHGRNVRYVLFKLHYGHSMDGFFHTDCVREKCFAAVLNDDEDVVLEALKGKWWNDSAWQAQDYNKIYGDLKVMLKKTSVAVSGGEVDGERYYFYRADLMRPEFSLAGMVSRAHIAKGMKSIAFLVFWVVGLLVLLFLMVLVVWFMIDRKHRERRRTVENAVPMERLRQEHLALLEQVGQEIRSPVSGIMGMGSVIRRESSDASVKEYAHEMQDAGQSLLALADNLIDYSKAATHELEIVPAEYDLFAILSSCFTIARNRNKKFNFTLQVEPSLPTRLLGDEMRLRQIFGNIFWNAEMLLPAETAKIVVGFERDVIGSADEISDSSVTLTITVPDSGHGWTGIGLILVKRLVHLMQGEFREDGTLDGSPAYVIALPQKVVKYEPMGDFMRRYEEMVATTGNGGKHFYAPTASILVIDEVPMNLRVIEGILKETHICLDAVSNGMEAIEKFKRSYYNIVFLDHTMPVIDGMNLLSIMKSLPNHPNASSPIVMLTGLADTKAREICKQAGYADFLTKPIREDALFTMLLKYLPENLIRWYDSDADEDLTVKENTLEREKSLNGLINGVDQELRDAGTMAAQPLEMPSLPDDLEAMRVEGLLNVQVGMECCERNVTLYRQKIKAFVERSCIDELERFLKAEDFENYRLMVRILKSRALFIGAIDIASRAKSLEFACNGGDYSYVHAYHDEMILKYTDLLRSLKERI